MKKLISTVLIACMLTFVSCSREAGDPAFEKLLVKKPYTALMFFAPDCPLCMTYSKPFNDLVDEYDEVNFVAVQSGQHYTAEEIQMFAADMQLKMPIFRDYDYAVATQFEAEITPEFFLVNEKGEVLYKGLLDDRMEQLGVYKQHWNRHFLKEAIESVLIAEKPEVGRTEAIGCVLEY